MPHSATVYKRITNVVTAYTDTEQPEEVRRSREQLSHLLQQCGTNIACMEHLRKIALQQNKWAPMMHRGGLQKMLSDYHQHLLPKILIDYQKVQDSQQQTEIEAVINYFITLYGEDQLWVQSLKNQAEAAQVLAPDETKTGIQILLQQYQMKILETTLNNFQSGYLVKNIPENIKHQVIRLLDQYNSNPAWMMQYQKRAKELQIWDRPEHTSDIKRLTEQHTQGVMQAAVRAYINKESLVIINLIAMHRDHDIWVAQLESYARELKIWEPTETHRGLLKLILEHDLHKRQAMLNAYKGAITPDDLKLTHANIAYLIHKHSKDPCWLQDLETEAKNLEIWFSNNHRNGIEKLVNAHLVKRPLIRPTTPPIEPVIEPVLEQADPIAQPLLPIEQVTVLASASPQLTQVIPPRAPTPTASPSRRELSMVTFADTPSVPPAVPKGSKKWSLFAGILCTTLCITFMSPVAALLIGTIIGLITFGLPHLIACLPEMPQPEEPSHSPKLHRHPSTVQYSAPAPAITQPILTPVRHANLSVPTS